MLCAPSLPTTLRRLQQNEQILGLIETMYNWIMQLDKQYVAQVSTCPEAQRPQAQAELVQFTAEVKVRLQEYLCWIIYQLFLPQLYKLQANDKGMTDKLILHIRAQAEDPSYEKKNEFVEFVEHCFALSKEILQNLPRKDLRT